MLRRGLLAIVLALFLCGTVEPMVARAGSVQAQQFKKKKPASTKAKATAKKKPKKKAPPKRTRTVKKKRRAEAEEPRRPLP